MILLCGYVPPDIIRKRQALPQIRQVVEFLSRRYSSFSLLGFADLNSNLVRIKQEGESKRLVEILRQCQLAAHFPTSRTTAQGDKESNLDYFLTRGVQLLNIEVGRHFGTSDHLVLKCKVTGASPVLRKKNFIFSKSKAARLVTELCDSDDPAPIKGSALRFFRRLSAKLRKQCIIAEPSPSNYFKAIMLVERELRSGNPDWRKIRCEILCNNKPSSLPF